MRQVSSFNLRINTRTSQLSADSSTSVGRFTNLGNIKVSNQRLECENGDGNSTLPWHPPSPCPQVSHVDERRRGWHYEGLWVLSLGRNEPLSLGYQPSPMTPRWSGGAVLLFHYHRGSRSMERRHHYPSGLMRLSRRRKRSGNYCWYSFQPGDAERVERDGGGIDSTHTQRLLAWWVFTCHHFSKRPLWKLIQNSWFSLWQPRICSFKGYAYVWIWWFSSLDITVVPFF